MVDSGFEAIARLEEDKTPSQGSESLSHNQPRLEELPRHGRWRQHPDDYIIDELIMR